MKQCISTSALLTSIFIFIALIFMMPISAQAANTSGEYVGFYEDPKSQTSDYGSVYTLYVTPKSNYVLGTGLTNSNQKEVAYCFNRSKGWSKNKNDGYVWILNNDDKTYEKIQGYTGYHKLDNVTGNQFADNAPKRRSSYTADEFRAKIISIGLNGYPYDYSGFNKDASGNRIVSDSAFRALTQYAIWYYTDAYNAEDDRKFTEAEKRIFRELINTTLPTAVTNIATSAIDLYLWDGNPAFDASAVNDKGTTIDSGYATAQASYATDYGYQNLLAVRTDDNVVETIRNNLAAIKTLTISKATTGSLGGTFTFDINLGTGASYWVNEQTADNVRDYGNGHVTVTLENGESVSLKITDSSYSYSIEETNASDYDTSISVKTGLGTVSSTNPKLISGTNVTGDTSILYTNTALNEPTRYPMYFIDDDDSDDDDDKEEEEEREREYENMDEETKTIWEEYMESRYGDDITVDRYGYVWKDNNIVDTIPSKKGSPDFTKKTVKLTESNTVPSDETTPDTSPKTADSSNVLFWLGLMAISVAGGAVILRRKIK
jgi:TQXA domain-containing protein/LPXTG-motif cell wall-anchored protein